MKKVNQWKNLKKTWLVSPIVLFLSILLTPWSYKLFCVTVMFHEMLQLILYKSKYMTPVEFSIVKSYVLSKVVKFFLIK